MTRPVNEQKNHSHEIENETENKQNKSIPTALFSFFLICLLILKIVIVDSEEDLDSEDELKAPIEKRKDVTPEHRLDKEQATSTTTSKPKVIKTTTSTTTTTAAAAKHENNLPSQVPARESSAESWEHWDVFVRVEKIMIENEK